jgi:copper chaperone CopZ
MEELTLSIPKMWADHHVRAVREALAAIGAEEIQASAARKLVHLSFDAAQVQPEQILQALAEAGYSPSETSEFPQPPANKEPESPWYQQAVRVTRTNQLDLEMSGDFRKY